MIGLRARTDHRGGGKVRQAVKANTFKSLGHAAAVVRITARRLIRRRKKPGPIGKPIGTQTGRAKRAFGYHVTKPDGPAVVGPMASRIGPAMRYHEKGGRRGRRYIPPRPVMGPTVAKIGPRLSTYWHRRG